MNHKEHWEHMYATKRETDVSWFQAEPRISLAIIRQAAPDLRTPIVDVGGGASRLVDVLLTAGYQNLTVVDISPSALEQAKKRLGERGTRVTWIAADALESILPQSGAGFWHDRALFHFLTDHGERTRYVQEVRRALRPGGHILLATFAEDGPQKCSGLPVVRYSAPTLRALLGDPFELLETEREDHLTPAGVHQSFQYCLFRYNPKPGGQNETSHHRPTSREGSHEQMG